MYRVFNLREALPIVPRPLRRAAPDACRPGSLFGDRRLRPAARRSSPATSATPTTMQVELVDGCGHFIADERPELVADRAREFFA